MRENEICTVIDVDERLRKVKVHNYTNDYISRAFGKNERPTFEEYEAFLESRCFPRERDKMKLILADLGLPFYDPFLNEDRHTHNIAVLMDDAGRYHYCPIFDNGAALLSDTTMDYPMNGALNEMIERPKTKTITQDFDEQLDIAEQLYGQHMQALW